MSAHVTAAAGHARQGAADPRPRRRRARQRGGVPENRRFFLDRRGRPDGQRQAAGLAAGGRRRVLPRRARAHAALPRRARRERRRASPASRSTRGSSRERSSPSRCVGPWSEALSAYVGHAAPARRERAARRRRRSRSRRHRLADLARHARARRRRPPASSGRSTRGASGCCSRSTASRPHEEDDWLDRPLRIGAAR